MTLSARLGGGLAADPAKSKAQAEQSPTALSSAFPRARRLLYGDRRPRSQTPIAFRWTAAKCHCGLNSQT